MSTEYINVAPLTIIGRLSSPFFTYSVPQELSLSIGNLVLIPFGKRSIRGIVIEISKKKKFAYTVKPISRLLSNNIFLTGSQIKLTSSLSKTMGISQTSVLRFMLPQKITLKNKKFTIPKSKNIKKRNPNFNVVSGYTDKDIVKLISNKINKTSTGQVLVLFPTLSRLEYAYKELKKKKIKKISIIHSTQTGSAFTNNYLSILSNQTRVIFALRNGPLLPFYNLEKVIVSDVSHSSYKQWDQSPFFDTRELLNHLAKIYKPKEIIIGTSYTTTILKQKIIEGTYKLFDEKPFPLEKIKIIPMQQTYTPVHDDILDIIKEKSDSNSAVIHNRTGIYRKFTCKDCDWTARCTNCSLPLIEHEKELLCHRCEKKETIPPFCPSCNSAHLKSFVPAISAIENFVLSEIKTTKKNLTFSTDSFLSAPLLPEYTTIVIVNADLELDYPSWDTSDIFLSKVAHLLYSLKPNGKLYIQTRNQERFIDLFTKSGLKKYEINEHSIRKQFNYPPFSDLVLLSKKINKNEDENLEKLKKTLEEKKINFYVYPNQTVSKKGIYQSILIKTDIHTKEWEYVVKDIPQDWSVNVHPHTI